MSIRLARELEPLDIWFLEEPVLPENAAAMADVARATSIPIATGERLFTKWGFREIVELRAAALLQPDVSHCGGILEARLIGALGELCYAGLAPHNPLSPVNTVASAHVGMASPNFVALEWIFDNPSWTHDVLTEPPRDPRRNARAPATRRASGSSSTSRPAPHIRTGPSTCRRSGRPTARSPTGERPLPDELQRVAESMRAAGLDFMLLSSPPNVTYAGGFESPLPVGFVADVTRSLPAARPRGRGRRRHARRQRRRGRAPRDESWWSRRSDVRDARTGRAGRSGPLVRRRARRRPPGGGARRHDGDRRRRADAPQSGRGSSRSPNAPTRVLRRRDGGDRGCAPDQVPREIELLRRAVAVADAGQRRLLELAASSSGTIVDAGLWAEAVGSMERLAGRILAVSGSIVTGSDTADWTSPGASGNPVAPGTPVLLDIGPRVDGYWADCANTVVFGAEPTGDQRRYLDASRAACLAGIDSLRPGRRCAEAWNAVRDAFEREGIPMSHYAGHQIGTSVNELPRLLPYDDTVIEAGMVFAVEAGGYAGPGGTMGARAEKVALVLESGPEILSAFSWDP